MTSMIDVVFLLLVFFLWTSSFDRPENDLPSQIAMRSETFAAAPDKTSVAQSDQTVVPEEIVVRIRSRADGFDFQVGSIDLSTIEAVRSKLKAIAALRMNTLLIIDPDDEVSMTDVIAVFDIANELRFRPVLFAVDS